MVYEHGGDVYRNKVRLDFSVNTNPLGMSENVKKAIAENIEQFGIYPDAMCVNLRNAIAEKEQAAAKVAAADREPAAPETESRASPCMPKRVRQPQGIRTRRSRHTGCFSRLTA